MALQCFLYEARASFLLALLGDVALEKFAFSLVCAPKVVSLAIDLLKYVIQVTAPLSEARHTIYALSLDSGFGHRTEPVPPETHRLMTSVGPSFREKKFDVPEAQRKTIYVITTSRMTSGAELKRLNGHFGLRRSGVTPPYPRKLNPQSVPLI